MAMLKDKYSSRLKVTSKIRRKYVLTNILRIYPQNKNPLHMSALELLFCNLASQKWTNLSISCKVFPHRLLGTAFL